FGQGPWPGSKGGPNTKLVKMSGRRLVQFRERPVSLYLVQGDSPCLAQFLEMAGSQASDFFELVAQVGRTGIVQKLGDLAQGEFIIDQEFLDPFDLLGNEVFFQGGALHFGEQFGKLAVFMAQGLAQMIRQLDFYVVVPVVYQIDDLLLDALDDPAPFFIDQFKAQGSECPL